MFVFELHTYRLHHTYIHTCVYVSSQLKINLRTESSKASISIIIISIINIIVEADNILRYFI